MGQPNPSEPSAFRLPTEVVELPIKGEDGEPLFVRIRAMNEAEYLDWKARLKQTEGYEDDEQKEAASREMLAWFGRSFVLQPNLFDGLPEPWEGVHFGNRMALMQKVVRLTVQGPGGADWLPRFPERAAGVGTGGGDQGSGGGAKDGPASGGGKEDRA